MLQECVSFPDLRRAHQLATGDEYLAAYRGREARRRRVDPRGWWRLPSPPACDRRRVPRRLPGSRSKTQAGRPARLVEVGGGPAWHRHRGTGARQRCVRGWYGTRDVTSRTSPRARLPRTSPRARATRRDHPSVAAPRRAHAARSPCNRSGPQARCGPATDTAGRSGRAARSSGPCRWRGRAAPRRSPCFRRRSGPQGRGRLGRRMPPQSAASA